MIDKIKKALNKLSAKEKNQIKQILRNIEQNKLNGSGYDIKKLAGRDDIYRIRKEKLRIIYRVTESDETYVLIVERRSDTMYNF